MSQRCCPAVVAVFSAGPNSLRRRLLNPKLRRIRLVVCDVDGVLTDGELSYDEEGKVLKRFDVRAGLAVRMLQQAGITVALLSGGRGGDGALREFSDALLASQGWMEGFETSGVGTTN